MKLDDLIKDNGIVYTGMGNGHKASLFINQLSVDFWEWEDAFPFIENINRIKQLTWRKPFGNLKLKDVNEWHQNNKNETLETFINRIVNDIR